MRSIPARIALALGFVVAAIALGAWTIGHTVLDPAATEDVAEALIGSDLVQEKLAEQLEGHVTESVSAPAVSPEIARAARIAVSDPRLVDAFTRAVVQVHRGVLAADGADAATLDLTGATEAVHDAIAAVDPELAARYDSTEPLRVDLGDGDLPRLEGAARRVESLTLIAAVAAVALFAIGVALHSPPRAALARVGRRVLFLGAGPVVGFTVVPWFLAGIGSGPPAITGTVLGAYGRHVLPTATMIAIGGLALWGGATWWPRGRLRFRAPRPGPHAPPAPPNPYATSSDAADDLTVAIER